MGSSLSGLTPKDTYQSLLKTTDNTACSTTLKTISDGSGNDTALQLSTLRLGVIADSSVTTQTSSVIQASTTDSSLVLAPNGTGGIIASIPDGTTTGGNARGQYSVDLQRLRAASTQVASQNYSTISGGVNNTIGTGTDATYSTISGGLLNSISRPYGFIGGGNSNSINNVGGAGSYAVLSGGRSNVVSSDYSTVSGGQSNTASTGTHATVVGGLSNTASGQYSVAGGFTNTASGQYSVALGNNNIASGNGCVSLGSSNTSQFGTSVSIGSSNVGGNNRTYAFGTNNNISAGDSVGLGNGNTLSSGNNQHAFGSGNVMSGTQSYAIGYQNSVNGNGMALGFSGNVSAPYATSMGLWSRAYLYGQVSMANGLLGGAQNAQQSLLTSYNSTALLTGGTQVLSLDGTGVTNLLIPFGSNRAWNVQVNWVAVVTAITGTATGISVGDVVTSVDLLGFKRVGGVSSASAHTSAATKTMVTTPAAYAACAIAYSAGASQEMAMTFTGPTFVGGGSVTMRVVARVELSEVAW